MRFIAQFWCISVLLIWHLWTPPRLPDPARWFGIILAEAAGGQLEAPSEPTHEQHLSKWSVDLGRGLARNLHCRQAYRSCCIRILTNITGALRLRGGNTPPTRLHPKHSNHPNQTDPVVSLLHGGHEGSTACCREDARQQGAGPSRPKPGVHREAEDGKHGAHEAFEDDGDGKSRRPLVHERRLVAVGGDQSLPIFSLSYWTLSGGEGTESLTLRTNPVVHVVPMPLCTSVSLGYPSFFKTRDGLTER